MELLLTLSQQENQHPYRFPGTGIQVYSFEEALYHVYHHWKQSVDDVASQALTLWVHDTLGLPRIAAKIKEVARIETFKERMLAFLGITPYFSADELLTLAPDLDRWEKRLEWETYKERADDFVSRGEPDKAIVLYRRALGYDENVPLLNNLAVAYMQADAPQEARLYLERALELDKNNYELLLHYSEALLLADATQNAAKSIALAEAAAPKEAEADLLYLRGELSLKTGKQSDAIIYFEEAIRARPEDQYIFRLADVYAGRRQFEKALEILDLTEDKSIPCLMKAAELHNLSDNIPAAINSIKKAIDLKPGHVDLWVRLARYERLNYNLDAASEAIKNALSLDSGNERARLECARVEKSMGSTRTYQHLLKGILQEFKGRYRE